MSIQAQAWVYKHSKARLADRLVLLAIADEADDDGTNAYPSQRRIAEKALVSQSTVRRCIENLERLGELRVHRPEMTGRGHFSTYEVLMEKGSHIEHLPGLEGDEKRAETRRNAPPMDGANPQTHRPLEKDLILANGAKRDLLFEAVCDATGTDWTRLTGSARGGINRAVAELRAIGAEPDHVAACAANYRLRFPDADLTPTALAKHWPRLFTLPPPRAPRGADVILRAVAEAER